jgi:hypothetical protein
MAIIQSENKVGAIKMKLAMLRNPVRIIRWWALVSFGLIKFAFTKITPESAYLSLIQLHCKTNGKSTNLLAKMFSITNPAKQFYVATGALGKYSKKDIQQIVMNIRKTGFHVFSDKLPEHICAQLEKIAREIPGRLDALYGKNASNRMALFDAEAPQSKRYSLPEEELIKHAVVQDLMADEIIRETAACYLQSNPILSSIDTWWSPAMGGEPDSEAAQLFHFDMHGAKWLKFFIYLTDVDSETGPHCLVQNSHDSLNFKGHGLLKRGYVRISDLDMEKAYGKENIIEVCGKRGTVIAVDTRCFHKGKPPLKNYRLLFQLVYVNSLFGSAYETMPKPDFTSESFKIAFQKNRKTYTRYK